MPLSVGRSAATWATMLASARPPSQGPKSAAATAPTMPQNARLWLHVPWKSGLAHPARIISESAFGRNCAAPTTRNVSGRGSSDAIASAIPRWPNCMVSPGRKSGDTLGPCRQADLKRDGSRSRRAGPVARHEAGPQQGTRPLVQGHDDAGDDRRDRACDENLGGDGNQKTERREEPDAGRAPEEGGEQVFPHGILRHRGEHRHDPIRNRAPGAQPDREERTPLEQCERLPDHPRAPRRLEARDRKSVV